MIGQRILALLLLVIPALIAMYGWNLMKNVIFDYIATSELQWLHFLLGMVLFLAGVAFVAGFVFHRDKKRKRLQPRFLKKKKKTNP